MMRLFQLMFLFSLSKHPEVQIQDRMLIQFLINTVFHSGFTNMHVHPQYTMFPISPATAGILSECKLISNPVQSDAFILPCSKQLPVYRSWGVRCPHIWEALTLLFKKCFQKCFNMCHSRNNI